MNKTSMTHDNSLIYLCDLSHTSPAYVNELTPYPIGCIKAWLLRYSRHAERLTVEMFKHPQVFIDSFLENKPPVVGFSNYMWNLDLSYTIAKEIKSAYPDTFILFGGPNYPLEDPVRERWLNQHPAVDMYIIGEAEEPFTQFIDVWQDTSDLEEARRKGIEGCHTLVEGKLFKTSNTSPRVKDLDLIPSPYIEGYLDGFLKEATLTPLFETNRGCPFTCTFCVDGISDRTKVYRNSIEKFEQELEYVAQRYDGNLLVMADLNFGMYRQDIETSKAIARVKSKYHYPSHILATTGKNQKERVLDCAEILDGALRLSAAVQSLDSEVLNNVKRSNISADKLMEMTKAANKLDANTFAEVILAMPGDTKEKHIKTTLQLADMNMKFISLYTLMILDGSELATEASRKQWNLKTKFRVVTRCIGAYDFQGKEVLSADIEEVCVENHGLSLDDYYESRSFALTMGIFYQDRIMYELYRFLENFDIHPSDVIPFLHERRLEFSQDIVDLFSEFDAATSTELWDNKEELEAYTKSHRSVIDKYLSGELGNNILYRHRAIAFQRLAEDVHEAAFGVAAGLLRDKEPAIYDRYSDYLSELKRYSLCRKREAFDPEANYSESFNYDFRTLMDNDFGGLPTLLDHPTVIHFFSTEDQKNLLKDELERTGSDLNGLAKLISRIPGSQLQRSVSFDDSHSPVGVSASQQFANPIPESTGEFI